MTDTKKPITERENYLMHLLFMLQWDDSDYCPMCVRSRDHGHSSICELGQLFKTLDD